MNQSHRIAVATAITGGTKITKKQSATNKAAVSTTAIASFILVYKHKVINNETTKNPQKAYARPKSTL